MPPSIILITGPSGAGKSTVSRQLASELGKCVDIDIEHINFMIVDGFYPQSIEPGVDVTFTKWELSGDTFGVLAKHFRNSGYSVIMHGHVTDIFLSAVQNQITITHKILLRPRLAAVISRDHGRRDQAMGTEMVKEHYRYFDKDIFQEYLLVDSTDESVKQTVSRIKHLITH